MQKKQFVIIKGKIETNLDSTFKLLLKKLNMTTQDFIKTSVLDFVSKNLFLIIKKDEQTDSK